jgi:hypothetical protein
MAVDVLQACDQCSASGGEPQTLFVLMSVLFSVYVALDTIFCFLVISRKAEEPVLTQTSPEITQTKVTSTTNSSTSYQQWLGPRVLDMDAHLTLRKNIMTVT